MFDIHCHILPGVDDGAKDWDTALEMCRMAHKDGIEHIVATPHANDEFSYDRNAHNERLERLRGMAGGLVGLSLGCDFHMSYENIQDVLKTPQRYCIANSRYLLVEFNDFSIAPTMGDVLLEMIERGIVPIITHPERNRILQRQPDHVVQWAKAGALVQITASSVTGQWGAVARRTIEFLLKRRAVHIIASDAHGTRSRPPVLSEAAKEMERLAGGDVTRAMVSENPRAIVNNDEIPHRFL